MRAGAQPDASTPAPDSFNVSLACGKAKSSSDQRAERKASIRHAGPGALLLARPARGAPRGAPPDARSRSRAARRAPGAAGAWRSRLVAHMDRREAPSALAAPPRGTLLSRGAHPKQSVAVACAVRLTPNVKLRAVLGGRVEEPAMAPRARRAHNRMHRTRARRLQRVVSLRQSQDVLRSAARRRQLRSATPAQARCSPRDRLVAHRVAHYPTSGRGLDEAGGLPAHPARSAAGSLSAWTGTSFRLRARLHHEDPWSRAEPTPNIQSPLPVLSG